MECHQAVRSMLSNLAPIPSKKIERIYNMLDSWVFKRASFVPLNSYYSFPMSVQVKCYRRNPLLIPGPSIANAAFRHAMFCIGTGDFFW